MKLLDFVCNRCNTRFEELVKEDTKVICPKCKSSDVRRVISGFATMGSNKTQSTSSCSSSRFS